MIVWDFDNKVTVKEKKRDKKFTRLRHTCLYIIIKHYEFTYKWEEIYTCMTQDQANNDDKLSAHTSLDCAKVNSYAN